MIDRRYPWWIERGLIAAILMSVIVGGLWPAVSFAEAERSVRIEYMVAHESGLLQEEIESLFEERLQEETDLVVVSGASRYIIRLILQEPPRAGGGKMGILITTFLLTESIDEGRAEKFLTVYPLYGPLGSLRLVVDSIIEHIDDLL